MGAEALSSRAIIGRFYNRLTETMQASWVGPITMVFRTNQEIETYKWLSMTPPMREWIGGRQAKGLRDNGLTIAQRKFESTLEIPVDWIRRDQTGQIDARIGELTVRTTQHWASLLSTQIISGETALCYDGQAFFDTDHVEGSSGQQSNDLSVDISALPAAVHGTTTSPSPQEMALVIFECISAILGFKDDQGEPMNDGVNSFVVMVPVPLMIATAAALNNQTFGGGETNVLRAAGFSLTLAVNPRLTWTTKIAVFAAGGPTSPLIRQVEAPGGVGGGEQTDDDMADVQIQAIAEGSELEFTKDVHQYGVRAQRNVGFGYWQKACLATMA